MPVVYRTSGKDLSEWAWHASQRTPVALSGLVFRASNRGAAASKAAAPIYNKARWSKSRWRFYRHHKRVPGGLKKSIRAIGVSQINSVRYRGGWQSRKRYASYVDEGFLHKRAKRRVPGRHYMEVGEKAVEAYIRADMPHTLAEIFKV